MQMMFGGAGKAGVNAIRSSKSYRLNDCTTKEKFVIVF